MDYSFTKVGIIGAGIMGAGITAAVAGAGIPVVLLDVVPNELTDDERARGISEGARIHRNRLAKAGLDRISDPKTGALYTPEMASYVTVGNLEDDLPMLRECDWIIEAVPEVLDVKRALFERVSPFIAEHTIISTNTSGLSVDSIAAAIPESLRSRFLGTHFFNPVRYMRLLEVIPGAATDPALTRAVADFGYRMLGKGVVIAKDTPNFIANRVGNVVLPTAFRLMGEYGYDFETVDYLTGPLIGNPKTAMFRLVDTVGLDVAAHMTDNLAAVLTDPDEKRLFALPDVMRAMIANGQLGNKTGAGFYRTGKAENGRRQFFVWHPEVSNYLPVRKIELEAVESLKSARRWQDKLAKLISDGSEPGRFVWDYLKSIMLYAAHRVPETAESYTDIDKAMRWGYNWGLGPFEMWDLLGFEATAERMKDEGATLPAWIEDRLANGTQFYAGAEAAGIAAGTVEKLIHSTLLDLGDGVWGLEIHAPGNAVSAVLRREVREAVSRVEADAAVKGLVLFSSSATGFLNGANLNEIVELIATGDPARLDEELRDFQETSLCLKYARKPVVAAAHGNALGGGLEFAMHCSRVVAHVDSHLGLVEAGVGLIPGGGGTKELLWRMSALLEGYAVADVTPFVRRHWEAIAKAEVSQNAFQARAMGYLRHTDRIIAQIDELVPSAKAEVLSMASGGFRQQLPYDVATPGDSVRASLQMSINAMREGGFISEYDAVVATAAATAITGGDLPRNVQITETEVLTLERDQFVSLCGNDKTLERIKGLLATGRPLRN